MAGRDDVARAQDVLHQIHEARQAINRAHEALLALGEQRIGCGHSVADLVSAPGTVTKCGACLAERQAAKAVSP
jgi:DNA-binding transcriptional LysR family regulator